MKTIALLVSMLIAVPVLAADYPAPKENAWVVRDFRFHTGEVLPELRLHYTTVSKAVRAVEARVSWAVTP